MCSSLLSSPTLHSAKQVAMNPYIEDQVMVAFSAGFMLLWSTATRYCPVLLPPGGSLYSTAARYCQVQYCIQVLPCIVPPLDTALYSTAIRQYCPVHYYLYVLPCTVQPLCTAMYCITSRYCPVHHCLQVLPCMVLPLDTVLYTTAFKY